MTHLRVSHQQKTAAPVQAGGILQRKCDCSNHSLGGRACDECGKKQMSLQRATQNAEPETRHFGGVPTIVHEVLRSSGHPLDAASRTFFEPLFGHN